MIKIERGNWQVTRWCCTSGLCAGCHERGTGLSKRVRVVQIDRISASTAAAIARNWNEYEPKAEPMPEQLEEG